MTGGSIAITITEKFYIVLSLESSTMRQIYFDYNATTPIAPSVVEAMMPYLHGHFGNPSSPHIPGVAAREAVEDSRIKIARMLGCDSDEIVFTSCGTESNNLAIKGVMLVGYPRSRGHLIVSAIEHASVLQPARFLEHLGYEVTMVPCNEHGVVSPESIENAIRPNTRLVSIMHANNETGTIQPIFEIAEICHQRNVLVHTDAVQSVGKIDTSMDDLNVDLLSLSGHKFYGPKGVGALFVRNGIPLEPLLHGASQELGRRSGTLNTASIVGMGHAALWSVQQAEESNHDIGALRDQFEANLVQSIPGLIINGSSVARLPNTSSVTFPEVTGFEILKRIPELCASLGTACHNDGSSISSTLSAMGCSTEHSSRTVRFSLGAYSVQEDVDRAVSLVLDAWEVLKG